MYKIKKAKEKARINFLVDKEDRIEIKRICAINDTTMSAFIRDAITEKIAKETAEEAGRNRSPSYILEVYKKHEVI